MRLILFSPLLLVSSSRCLFEGELINNCHFSSPLHSSCFKLLCKKIGSGWGRGLYTLCCVYAHGCACMYVCVCLPELDSYAHVLKSSGSPINIQSHSHVSQCFPPFSTFTLHFISTPFFLSLTPLLFLFLLSLANTICIILSFSIIWPNACTTKISLQI